MVIFEKLRQWTLHWIATPYADAALFLNSFSEASFFPIPADILMVSMILVNPKKWRFYALLVFIGSILGALLGYLIGWGFYEIIGQKIVDAYNLQGAVDFIGGKYSRHAFITVFIGALTPIIPFNVVAITSGLFHIPLLSLISATIVGRAIRYFSVAYAAKIFGRQAKDLVFKYFKVFSVLVVMLIVIILVALKFYFK